MVLLLEEVKIGVLREALPCEFVLQKVVEISSYTRNMGEFSVMRANSKVPPSCKYLVQLKKAAHLNIFYGNGDELVI